MPRTVERERGQYSNRGSDSFQNDGSVVAQLEDFKVQQISRAVWRQMSGVGSERLLYDLNWEPFRLPASETTDTKWLLIHGESEHPLTQQITAGLADKGHQSFEVQISQGSELTNIAEGGYRMDGESIENWRALFEQLGTEDSPFKPSGIAWLFDIEFGRGFRLNEWSFPRNPDRLHRVVEPDSHIARAGDLTKSIVAFL